MGTASPKPPKGTARAARRAARVRVVSYEKAEKAKVVRRDGAHTCRLVPWCRERAQHQTAHLDDKGAGGDHGRRSSADAMLRSCGDHHQGAYSLHSGDLRVVRLTDQGTNGPIEVWGRTRGGGERLLKRETACGVNGEIGQESA